MEAKFRRTKIFPTHVYKNRSQDKQSGSIAKKNDFNWMKLETNGFNKNIDRRKKKCPSAKP
jgi:hypothetical protein